MISLTLKKQKCLNLSLTFFCIILLGVTLANASETVTLQLKWKHQFQFAGYYAAIEQGYYLEEGLEVVLLEGKPGAKEVEEVISGRANFGVGMSDILLSKFQGKSIVLIANIFQHSPVTLLTTKKIRLHFASRFFQKKYQNGKRYQVC
jgi:ABC-type nitrate/sulfonate/bicarbonate transport system substrate-binding protein